MMKTLLAMEEARASDGVGSGSEAKLEREDRKRQGESGGDQG